MKNIQDYKKEAILNKTFRYPEGIMTRRQWLKMMHIKGWQAEERTRRNHAAEEKLEEWLRVEKMNVPLGNSEYPSTKHYLQEKQRLAAGIFKTEYCLKLDNSIYDITKTEYEAFKALQLEEDINTQKNELSEKIETGTATDAEIDEAMQKEFEFAKKYF